MTCRRENTATRHASKSPRIGTLGTGARSFINAASTCGRQKIPKAKKNFPVAGIDGRGRRDASEAQRDTDEDVD